MATPSTWPDNLYATARELYESGKHSAKQIAALIGYGKTKNSIISIARRRGWVNPSPKKGGTKPGDKRPRPSKPRAWLSKPLPPLPPIEILKPENFLGLTMQQLGPRQCRYPDGDGPFFFCGQLAQSGSSYCAYHHSICWEKPARRPDRQFVSRQNF